MNKIIYSDYSDHSNEAKKAQILNAIKDNTIQELQIGYLYIDEYILQIFEYLSTNNSLHKLILNDAKIGNDFTKLCTYINQNKTISALKIDLSAIYNEGICALAELLHKNTTITSLSIRDTNLNELNIAILFNNLCDDTHLQKLSIDCDTLSGDNFKSLVSMLTFNKTLRNLVLDMSSLRIRNFRIIADALQKNVSLEKLTLCSTDQESHLIPFINKKSICIIIDALSRNYNLKYLKIWSNFIENKEAFMIANLLKTNNSLEYLKLYCTNIKIKGVISLCNQSSLKCLSIEPHFIKQISNEDIDELSKVLCENTTLTEIGIQSCAYNNFWNILVTKIEDNYNIVNIIGLDLEEKTDPICNFLDRNIKIANETRFKKVKALM